MENIPEDTTVAEHSDEVEVVFEQLRLDVYVQKMHPELSRATIQKIIKAGDVLVNTSVVSRPSYSVKHKDTVVIRPGIAENLQPARAAELADSSEGAAIDVVYEDEDCVVIYKPTGLLTHSKGVFNPEATVATWLAKRQHFNFPADDDPNQRAGIVHRLDRATSGIMICAKNSTALRHLQKQFQDRKAKKTYIARVAGTLQQDEAFIDIPIERNPKQPQRFRAGHNGKPAQTVYRVIQTISYSSGKRRLTDSIVELKPTTGRTHQLRVHLAYLGHPIVGDAFYDGRPAQRLYLHASGLEITLPNKSRRSFTVSTPEDFFEDTTK